MRNHSSHHAHRQQFFTYSRSFVFLYCLILQSEGVFGSAKGGKSRRRTRRVAMTYSCLDNQPVIIFTADDLGILRVARGLISRYAEDSSAALARERFFPPYMHNIFYFSRTVSQYCPSPNSKFGNKRGGSDYPYDRGLKEEIYFYLKRSRFEYSFKYCFNRSLFSQEFFIFVRIRDLW